MICAVRRATFGHRQPKRMQARRSFKGCLHLNKTPRQCTVQTCVTQRQKRGSALLSFKCAQSERLLPLLASVICCGSHPLLASSLLQSYGIQQSRSPSPRSCAFCFEEMEYSDQDPIVPAREHDVTMPP